MVVRQNIPSKFMLKNVKLQLATPEMRQARNLSSKPLTILITGICEKNKNMLLKYLVFYQIDKNIFRTTIYNFYMRYQRNKTFFSITLRDKFQLLSVSSSRILFFYRCLYAEHESSINFFPARHHFFNSDLNFPLLDVFR